MTDKTVTVERDNANHIVEIKHLVKTYNGKFNALDGVNLKIEEGKVFALLGPNGAGKTTLMRILTTQLKTTFGEAYVSGLNVASQGSEVRRIIGYIPQEMSVWTDLTGFDNLIIYAKIYGIKSKQRKKVVQEALDIMGLGNVANSIVKTYSGGMIRRLEIACTLLIKPRILFLDEPTIGLDPSARKAVWEQLTSFKKECGSTIFFNTHYMDEADLYADEIAIISSGRLVGLGTVEELKRSVGGEVIRLSLESHNVGKPLLNKVEELSLVKDVRLDDSEISVIAEDAETTLPKIIKVLGEMNIFLWSNYCVGGGFRHLKETPSHTSFQVCNSHRLINGCWS